MPTCLSNSISSYGYTVTALSSPADGYSYSCDGGAGIDGVLTITYTCVSDTVQVTCTNNSTETVSIFLNGNLYDNVFPTGSFNQNFSLVTSDYIDIAYPISTYNSNDIFGVVQVLGSTPTPTASAGGPTPTPTSSPTPSASAGGPTPTPTSSPTPSASAGGPTATPTRSPTPTVSPSPSANPTFGTATPTPSPSLSLSPTPTPAGPSSSPTLTPSPTPSPTPTPTNEPTQSPEPTATFINKLFLWGANTNGQLGQNNTENYNYPKEVISDGIQWQQIDAGDGFIGGLLRNNDAYEWGKNDAGQLGTNTVSNYSSPVENISGVSGWIAVNAGGAHSAGLENSTPSASPTPSFTATPEPTVTPIPTNTPSATPLPTVTLSPTPLPTVATPTPTMSPTASATPGPSVSPTRTPGPTASPVPTVTLSPTPTASPAPTSTPIPTGQAGYLYAWGGDNEGGMLGTNTTGVFTSVPVLNIMSGNYWQQVSSGYYQAGAIKNDGTLWMWGYNIHFGLGNGAAEGAFFSSPVQTAVGGNNWAQLSIGKFTTAAIKNDTTLWTWGFNGQGACGTNTSAIFISTPTQVVFPSDWQTVSCGNNFVMAIKTDGSIWGWGNNEFGQCGFPLSSPQYYFYSPVQSGDSTYDWLQVASGYNFCLGIKKNGTLWGWGYNYYGQLGFGNGGATIGVYQPLQVGTSLWSQVAAGNGISVAIRSDGSLFTWGYNGYGALGDGSSVNRSSPVKIGTNTNWTNISAGVSNITARKSDNTIWTAGYGLFGRLGNNSTISVSSFVQTGSLISGWKSADIYRTGYGIAQGTPAPSGTPNPSPSPTPTITLTPPATPLPTPTLGNFKLNTWGFNYIGQLGNNAVLPGGTGQSTPIQIGSATNWSLVTSLTIAFYAIKSDGTMWSWGDNQLGALGLNSTMNKSVPTQIGTGTDWAQLSVGPGGSGLAIKNNGQLYAWGSNTFGALSTNNTITYSSPVLIAGNTWYMIASGGLVTAGIDTQGRLWTCGQAQYGAIGDNFINNRSSFVQTAIGGADWSSCDAGSHILAIKTNGTLWAWGDNYYGSLGTNNRQNKYTPEQIGNNSNWSQIAVGTYMSAALKQDGSIWAWGRNHLGQLGDGTIVNRSSPVQIGNSTDWTAISCGYYNVFALKNNGTLWGWGNNNGGNLGNNSIVNRSSPIQVGVVNTYFKLGPGTGSAAALRT